MLPADQQRIQAFDEDDAEMGKRQLRQQQDLCREYLQALEQAVDLRQLATVQQLCEALGTQRQRPIYLEARPLPPPLTGVCIGSKATDYVFYAEDAPLPLQEHIILHEVAHVLLGLPETLRSLIARWEVSTPPPALPPALLDAALKRTCYDNESECLAEMLATLIEQRWRTLRQRESDLASHLWGTPDLRWLSEQAGDVG